ncbi:hypothetical protein GCM10009555_017720 [Acrocarpospora macrocephala]|uniref:Uncharacterized protein n=1 Tax=Acrocarpospora macrocephala TaxID=150177 RepID=A0A5M3WH31_9ACTN|nr:hypothetical protein [Acrocarpospora macrocephala]GES07432.1 hypothetical protein Amac_010270 [Acrocarpospora macrocephala]
MAVHRINRDEWNIIDDLMFALDTSPAPEVIGEMDWGTDYTQTDGTITGLLYIPDADGIFYIDPSGPD